MSKRPADKSAILPQDPPKKLKTRDIAQSSSKSLLISKHYTFNSCFIKTTETAGLSNSYEKTLSILSTIGVIPDYEYGFNIDHQSLIDLMKLIIIRLQFCKLMPHDTQVLFPFVSNVLYDLRTSTKVERLLNLQYYTVFDYAFKQTELFSTQYFITKRKIQKKEYKSEIQTLVLSDREVCRKELNIQARQIIAYISKLAKISKKFSEQTFVQGIVVNHSQNDIYTIVGLLCSTALECVKDSRYVARNFGIIYALTDFLRGLTSHYRQYDEYHQIIDEGFKTLFGVVLKLATYDIELMVILSECFVNIAKDPDRLDLFRSMCIRYTQSNPKYINSYRLYPVEVCGCKFDIFFILVTHVIRLYDYEYVRGESLLFLLKVASNFNSLAYTLLTNSYDIKFLQATKKHEKTCTCFRNFLMSCLIINNLAVRNRNSDPRYYELAISTTRDGILIINNALNYIRQTSSFLKFKFSHTIMNEIYSWVCYGELLHPNHSRTRNFSENFSLFVNPSKFHDYFLEKFKVNCTDGPDDELSDSIDTICDSPPRAPKFKIESINTTKADIFNEIAEDFSKDESLNYGYDNCREVF